MLKAIVNDLVVIKSCILIPGTDLVGKLLKMQQLEDDDELAYSVEEGLDQTHVKEGDGRPSWMRTLHNSASTWLQLLPKSLQVSCNR
jgi:dynein heavy chain 1